ncbi:MULTISPECIES: Zn-ribbon domain-containing OB-fold protein [unclassified Nocardioides]|uniref:Zn-ribbon domain-containing OB-fold protein n=1 Tax=unclassified Nocardioides TaxID=2615069 RepID=UPI003014D1D9
MTVRPMINRDSQFFWDGTAAGELRIQTCNACGAKRFPPGPACQECEAYDRGFEVAAGTGTVFSYVVHRHPPVPGKELPIVIALVDLDEGVRMVAEVVDVPPEEIAIGQRLRVDFKRVDDELTLPVWRLDTPRSSAARRPEAE